MKLVFVFGLPATGKLTIGRLLAERTGYKIFHNHLVVDLLLSVFEFGSAPFVALREDIWLSVIGEALASSLPGLIFTFNPESTVSEGFVSNVQDVVHRGGGSLDFIELTAPVGELRKRMDAPSRQQNRKLTSVPLFEQLHASGAFDVESMPEPTLAIDTSCVTPAEAVERIATKLGLTLTRT